MKAKHWMIALIVALMSVATGAAQEGQSTVEGVPVVDEIVTDSSASDEPAAAQAKSTTKVGTWHITTYTTDSLGTSDTIELTGEMIDDMPDFLKGLFKLTGIGIASSTILLVVGILLLVFGLPLLLLFLLLYLLFRRGKSDTSAPQATDTPATDRTLFNKGVKNICLGVGLAICLGIWMGDIGVGIGILIACIGIGELLIDHFSRK